MRLLTKDNLKKRKKIKQSLKKIKSKVKDKIGKRKLNTALVFTFIRIILSPIIMVALLLGKFKTAVILFIIAGLTDYFDGYFARKEKNITFFGKIIDPIADKFLINLTAIGLVIRLGFPLWALIIFLIKDIGIIFYGLYMLTKDLKRVIKTTIFSKATTFLQIVAIVIFVLGEYFSFFEKISIGAIFIACFFTIYTVIDYMVRYYKAKPRKIEEFHFKILLKLPDYITMLNALCGVVAIFLAFYKMFVLSCVFMLLAIVFDYYDGKVARKIGREGNFGKELDSLTDIVSFGVAPAVFGISLLQDNVNTLFLMIVMFLFILFGLLRLARYNVIEMKGIYYGMPITFNAVVISLIYFVSLYYSFSLSYWLYVYLVLGLLMVGPFKVKKG